MGVQVLEKKETFGSMYHKEPSLSLKNYTVRLDVSKCGECTNIFKLQIIK